MGDFLGHFLCGVAFLCLSMWWAFNTSWNYWKSKMTGELFLNRGAYHHSAMVPWEAVIKVLVLSIDLLSEMIVGCGHINNSHHITIIGFFFLNAGMDFLTFYKVPSPDDLDYLSGILAFAMEGFMFSEHAHDRSPLDQKVHSLITYSAVVGALCVMVEMVHRNSWAAGMIRSSALMVHGAWMMQAGFILYPDWVNRNWSAWEPDDPHQMMMVPMMFAWHIMAVIMFQGTIMLLMYKRAKSEFGSESLELADYALYSRLSDQQEELDMWSSC